jgi:hypothetical protein
MSKDHCPRNVETSFTVGAITGTALFCWHEKVEKKKRIMRIPAVHFNFINR